MGSVTSQFKTKSNKKNDNSNGNNSNSISDSSSGPSSSASSNSKPNVKVTPAANEEHKDDEELSQMEAKTNADVAETSTKEDPSLPNVLSHFAKLLGKPSLSSFEQIVSASKTNWDTILDVLKKLSKDKEIDAKQVQDMEAIYNDYWLLLLRTRLGIEILIKKGRLQRRNVGILLEIVQECRRLNGENKDKDDISVVLSADDEMARRECIAQLGKWLGNEELDTLMKEWETMQTRLEEQQKKWDWDETCARVSSKKRREMFGYMAVALAGILVVALSVTLIVVTCGGATPVVAGVAVALTATEISGVVLSGLTIATVGILGTISTYKYLKDLRAANERKKEMFLVVVRVQKLLAKMIASSQSFQVELNKSKCNAKMEHEVEFFENVESLRNMAGSLKTISQYLDEYISQGQVVIVTVDKACQEMIHC